MTTTIWRDEPAAMLRVRAIAGLTDALGVRMRVPALHQLDIQDATIGRFVFCGDPCRDAFLADAEPGERLARAEADAAPEAVCDLCHVAVSPEAEPLTARAAKQRACRVTASLIDGFLASGPGGPPSPLAVALMRLRDDLVRRSDAL